MAGSFGVYSDADRTRDARAEDGGCTFAGKSCAQAENTFLETLERIGDNTFRRRCRISPGELYRDCMALDRIGPSPISVPASRSVEILSKGIMENALRYDPTLWELLALTYLESYHTDSVPDSYLQSAAGGSEPHWNNLA